MKNIVGVRFKKPGKIYFFDPGELNLEQGTKVIVETAMGNEYGEVAIKKRQIQDERLTTQLKQVIRIATDEDKKMLDKYKAKEQEAYKICEEKIKNHNLQMELKDVEYAYDGSKLMFYFKAEGRIDFRELVKELASIFKTRIELRQIGVRDEVRRIGGNGICGRELCCCSYLGNFETVSIKMAKEQNISLNPSKISGNCGRLMCCLKYEQEVYEEKLERLPNIGAIVKTPDGEGIVENVEILKEQIRVKLRDGEDYFYKKYLMPDIKIIKNNVSRKIDEEEKQHLKELQELEKLQKLDAKNK
ncbi:MAG TPA: stage 0 sporulation family protein [Clostridia bacterium]|nr:stage 0 sporulation family protein [Clostridia bacterium]